MYQLFLVFSLFLSCNAFILNPLPQLMPILTDLEGIITSKAISTSFITNLRNEFTLERVFIPITELNNNTSSYLIFSFIFTYIYGHYKFTKGTETCRIDKFKRIDKFEKIDRITKDVLFIILFVFTKDIQNAI